jgi:hypothetical protein
VLRQNEDNHYLLRVVGAGTRRAELVTRIKGETKVVASHPLEAGPVKLEVDAYPRGYDFYVRLGSDRGALLIGHSADAAAVE